MNDTELDEILNRWIVAAPAPALRENVRAAFVAAQPVTAPRVFKERERLAFLPAARRALLAAALVVVGVFLFVAVQALSQTPPPVHIPYTVDSEFLRYGDDGTPTVEMLSTSYPGPYGGEVVLSRSIPGNSLATAAARTLDAVLPAWQRLILPFTVSPKDMEKFKKMRQSGIETVGVISGCADRTCLVINHWGFRKPAAGTSNACVEGDVVGSETILSHATTGIQRSLGSEGRITLWMAPDLGCFALRITTEALRPDGTVRLVQTKQALKVTLKP